MNEQDLVKKARRKRREQSGQTSKLGYILILSCVLIIVIAMFVIQQFPERQLDSPHPIAQDAVNASAYSSAWLCPIVGDSSNADTLLIANTSPSSAVSVVMNGYESAGVLTGTKTISIEASSMQEVPIAQLNVTPTSTISVESFSGAVAVFRSILLSDGFEYTSCQNSFSSKADYVNLETIRNSNAELVLANPYPVSVVLDLTARLVDNTSGVPVSSIADKRGIVIPPHGRVSVNLQETFGRYPIVGVHIESRVGFFTSEVLLSFNGAESGVGQTIVSSSKRIKDSKPKYWVGILPTRLVALNDTTRSQSIVLSALAPDNRSISNDSIMLSPGLISVLDNIGSEFSSRTLTLTPNNVEDSSHSLYASWIHVGNDAVSSGSVFSQASKSSIVVAMGGDVVHIYNPGNKVAKVTLKIMGKDANMTREVKPKSYSAFSIEELQITADSLIQLDSSEPIMSSSSDENYSRYFPAQVITR